MGVDCSNCKCTNREEESILIIDNSEKYFNTKVEIRKDRPDMVKSKVNVNMNFFLNVHINK